ncbi:MAG: peptide chain release factor N(5)-glutamine methyltransferase [Gammaproteobacteria bacterium]|nr:MAG: peptide chain release factor N(5)-glutamine methyltransferase [Gammaproteobacteria bacterium]
MALATGSSFGGERIALALQRATGELASVSDTPRLDAEILLAHAMGTNRTHAYANPEQPLSTAAAGAFAELLSRRLCGEPVAYLVGEREFWSLSLKVNPHTLIPRPETETLVEQALQRIPADADWRVADLGTGAGGIALALARERPRLQVDATDNSPQALELAKENARRAQLANVSFFAGDWCAALPTTGYQLILSNPPYVPTHDPHLRQGDVRFEPEHALVAGADGLDALRRIADQAGHYLSGNGHLLMEHGFDQAQAVAAALAAAGFQDISLHRDLADQPRVTEAVWPKRKKGSD